MTERLTVDLTPYPDLVVICLGMRVNMFTGLKTLFGFGPRIAKAVADQPEGLLLHETLIYSLLPPHIGMRQYWRDFESLENWARSTPHQEWWKGFLKDSGGTGFWHESYFMRGGMEAVYVDVPVDIGFCKFANVVPARASMFSARGRAARDGSAEQPVPMPEAQLYPGEAGDKA